MIKMKTLTIGGTTYEIVDEGLGKSVVRHDEQILTEEQKTQARENIGAASAERLNSIIVTVGGDTLTWDGNTEGRTTVDVGDGHLMVHVSDAVPVFDDFANGCSVWIRDISSGPNNGMEAENIIGAEYIFNVSENIIVCEAGHPIFSIANRDNCELEGVVFPKAGIYLFVLSGLVEVFKITIPSYTGFNAQEKIAPSHLYQSDWNQTDETAADFIKNKPFGDELVEILPETEAVGMDADGMYSITLPLELFSGSEETMLIVFDGAEYVCDVDTSQGLSMFGDMTLTTIPFCLAYSTGFGIASMLLPDGNPHTVAISSFATVPIAPKYAPKNKAKMFIDHQGSGVGYLSWDVFGDTKVTKAELQAISESDTILEIRSEWDGAFRFLPQIIGYPASYEFGYVLLTVPQPNEEFAAKLYFTAEYTG